MIRGFRDFVLRGNVVDLAVAVVIGAAFGAVVTAIVTNLLTPLIGAILGTADFGALAFSVNESRFGYGEVVNAIVSFLAITAVVYFVVVVPMTRIQDRLMPRKPVDKPVRPCPECESEIPATARRCSFCTSAVGPAPAV